MKACSKKILLSLLIYVCSYSQIHQAEADYLLGIRIHNYSNLTNQCPACSIQNDCRCCDSNTYFYYCLHCLDGSGECMDGRISYENTEQGKIDLDFRGGLLLKLPKK